MIDYEDPRRTSKGLLKRIVTSGSFKQQLSGFSASLGLAGCLASYAWFNPASVFFKSHESPIRVMTSDLTLMSALPELIAGIVAPLTGIMADRFGRKLILLLCGPINIALLAGIYYAETAAIIIVIRVLQGIPFGVALSILPIYLGEISQPATRLKVVNFFQLSYQLGILFILIVGAFCNYKNLAFWCMVPHILFTVSFMWCADTPYYWILKGNREKAKECLGFLRDEGSDIDTEMESIENSITEDLKSKVSTSDIFRKKEIYKPLIIVTLSGFLVFMAGAIAIFNYASVVFMDILETKTVSNYVIMSIGFVTLGSTVLGPKIVQWFGKRRSVIGVHLIAIPFLAAEMIYYLLYQYLNKDVSNFSVIPLVCDYMLYILLSLLSPLVVRSYQSELFTTSLRGLGSASATASICFGIVASVAILGSIQKSVYCFVAYIIFIASDIALILMFYFYVPETNGMTFDKIQQLLKK